MTPEEKELLLKDLCGRLQNKVMIYLHTSSQITGSAIVLNSAIYGFIEDVLSNSPYEIKEIKPYLRPMSSMTEDEINEYENFITNEKDDQLRFCNELIFYNSHHFDYRGLIPKGLALEAPEDMYK